MNTHVCMVVCMCVCVCVYIHTEREPVDNGHFSGSIYTLILYPQSRLRLVCV